MIDDMKDARIAQLLMRGAPAERDPLFQVKVLERRERQQYRRNLQTLLGAVIAISVLLAVGLNSGELFSGIARGALFAAAMGIAAVVYVPLFARLWRASIGGGSAN